MAKIQRNARCPCGSGRKQKSCCGKLAAAAEFTRARIRRCEGDLVQGAIPWARHTYGEEVILEAWDEFTMGILDFELLDDEEYPFSVFFYPWWLYGGSSRTDVELSPVMTYLDDSGASEDAFERHLAETIEKAPFSFHRVADVDPGRSMMLEDVMTGERRVVVDHAASTMDSRSTYVFARVAPIDGVVFMFGSGPFLVEPSYFTILKALRDDLQQVVGGPLTDEHLHEFDVKIRLQYINIVSRILDPAPPRLVNTGGDPIAPTHLVYDLDCDCEYAFEKLRTLAKGWKRSDLIEDAERDEAGRLRRISFNWVELRKPDACGRGNLILGFLSLENGRLDVEVNSGERADRIRARIARRLGSRAKLRHAVVDSIEKMWEQARSQDRPVEPITPETRALAAELSARHWKAWLDQPLSALEGITPREAARNEGGRELLQALLADFDRKVQQMPDNPMSPDPATLRRALGLR